MFAQVSVAFQSFGTQIWMFVWSVHRASSTQRPLHATHVRHWLAHWKCKLLNTQNWFLNRYNSFQYCSLNSFFFVLFYQQVHIWRKHMMCGNWQPSPVSQCWLSCLSVPRWLSGSCCIDASHTNDLYVVRVPKLEEKQKLVLGKDMLVFSLNHKECLRRSRLFHVPNMNMFRGWTIHNNIKYVSTAASFTPTGINKLDLKRGLHKSLTLA